MAVADIRLFNVNQFPYLEVERPFILGTAEEKWKPTISHIFVEIMHQKGILQRLYTQNIDGLYSALNIPTHKIVNLHGSISKIECEFCKTPYPLQKFREEVQSKIRNIYDSTDTTSPATSSNICCARCKKPRVKPATVMFGSDLPSSVWSSLQEDFPANVDLLIIAGTSLTVSPACNIVTMVSKTTPRLLINQELVGSDLGLYFSPPSSSEPSSDLFLAGDCDAEFLKLAQQVGWLENVYASRGRFCDASAEAVEKAWQDMVDNKGEVGYDLIVM